MRQMLDRIWRWLNEPNVRLRILCFGLYVAGLVLYACSSTFTHLFGEWTSLKIFLYVIVSSFFCLVHLLRVSEWHWQEKHNEITFWFGVSLTCSVLIFNAAYTFFSDEKTEGSKPDAYIILSLAAFAVSSLCLSRETHSGFDVDFLHLYCHTLIIKLMKIKSWPLSVGALFTCSLIMLRAYLERQQRHENRPPSSSDGADDPPHNPPPSSSDDSSNPPDIPPLSSSDDPSNPPDIPPLSSSGDGAFEENSLAQQLNIVIEELRNENQKLISAVSDHVDNYIDTNNNDPVDVNLVVDTLPRTLINNLQEKVKVLVAAGFEKQCCCMYSSWRREFLSVYLSRFELEVEDLNDENMMEKTDKSWKKAFTAAMKILFPNERSLFNRVFEGLELSSAADISFREFCRQSLMPLLSFADTLVMTNHPRDLTRRINDPVQTLTGSSNGILRQTLDFWLQDFRSNFENQNSFSRRSEVLVLWRTVLLKIDINECIYSDDNYSALSPESIIELVMSELSKYYAEDRGNWVNEHWSFLSSLNTWVLDRLECHLEAQLKNHNMNVLDQHFVYMVNNLNHVKIKAEELRLQLFLGNDWFNKINAKVQEKIELYQRDSWNEVLDQLKLDTNESAESMKGKLNLFNDYFEQTCKEQSEHQSTRRIFDEELWEQIIKSLEDILLPAYEKFFKSICQVLGNDDDECIKYKPAQIKAQLRKLLRYDIHWGIERGNN